MKLLKEDEYEDLAMEFQYKIIELLDKNLKEKGIKESERADICGDFNFDLSNFIDQGEIEWVNSGVLFHEYAFGVSSDYFENTDA